MGIDAIEGLLPHQNKSKSKNDTMDFMDDLMEDFMAICRREVIDTGSINNVNNDLNPAGLVIFYYDHKYGTLENNHVRL